MIYLPRKGNLPDVVILETENVIKIHSGKPAVTHDKAIIIAWTPDPEWLLEQLRASDGSFGAACRLIDESTKRPQAPLRPKHGPEIYNIEKPPTG